MKNLSVLALGVFTLLSLAACSSTNSTSESSGSTSISSTSEIASSETTSTTSIAKVELKSKIDLSGNGPYEFSGSALITPEKATIKNNELELFFEWRNDDGTTDERSFLGSGLAVVVTQNGKELEGEPTDLSGEDQSIKKNTSLEINYSYKLNDDSPITVSFMPLEGDDQSFTFDIK